MDRDALRAYALRRWSAGTDEERRYWADRYRSDGPAATIEAGQALWRHMREVRPDWPDQAAREADLQHHVTFKRLLERCPRVLPAG